MRRLKIFLLSVLCILTMPSARGFSLLGPFEAWMTPPIGYDPFSDGQMLGGPMNIGEEYRWNLPTITYAFDESFLNYFGSNGVRAIDQAMGILNAVPPVSTLSSNLVEYPLDSQRVNLR